MEQHGPVPGARQEQVPLEDELAGVLSALLADSRSAKDAVMEIAEICMRRAADLRRESVELLHRPARHMHLKAMAEEMEAHAATWNLVFCLYCDEAAPAGDGGRSVTDAGDAQLYRHRVADCVSANPELARCARVVAWLESQADDILQRQGAAAAFAQGEGLWRETKTEMRSRSGAVVSELDPDAPSRTGRSLHASNARAQERIMARVWQLLRAGRTPDALGLCRQVGQAWRSAVLGAAGEYGALPVGSAATEHDEVVAEGVQAEELAAEVATGSGSLLALWRWACLQAAGAAGDKYERATCGALGGGVAAMSPACSSWEDFAWVYCRSWLEVHSTLLVPPQPYAASDLVSGDLVVTALERCGVAPAVAQRSLEGASAVVMGSGWPTEQQHALASRNFGALFNHFVMAPAAMVGAGSPAVRFLRQVQCLLIQDDTTQLAAQLHASLVDRPPAGDATAPPDESMALADAAAATGGNDKVGGLDGGGAEQRWRMAALSAHLLLVLEALGVMPGIGGRGGGGASVAGLPLLLHGGRDVDPFEAHKAMDISQRLLTYYCAQLLERDRADLATPYLCCLRPQLRATIASEVLELHTRRLTGLEPAAAAPGEDAAAALGPGSAAEAECVAAYGRLAEWFDHCTSRQEGHVLALSERLPSSNLMTDIRPGELRLILAGFCQTCRASRAYGPQQRARVVRWLVYPYLAALQQQQEREEEERDLDLAGGGGAAAGAAAADLDAAVAARAAASLDSSALLDLLDLANCLCAELSLGDDACSAAGQLLFAQVLPEGLEEAVAAVAQGMAAAAAAGDTDAPEGSQDQELAQALWDEATELRGWRQYYGLEAQLTAWAASREALQAGMGSAPELVEAGAALLEGYMNGVLRSGWQQELSSVDRALAAAGPSGASSIALGLTVPPASATHAGAGGAGWGQPTALYPELKGAELFETELAVRTALGRATAGGGGLSAVAAAVEAPTEAQGHITVTLSCSAQPQPWAELVSLACSIIRSELPGLPPLLLANLHQADSRATRLAVSRTCCIGQVALRCAALRQELVGLGQSAAAAGADLAVLLAAPPAGPADPNLCRVLSAHQMHQVLRLEGNTLVQDLRNQQQQQAHAR